MGSGTSAPEFDGESVSIDEAKRALGSDFDEEKFNALRTEDGTVPKAAFLEAFRAAAAERAGNWFDQTMHIHSIKNDSVESELSYAKKGSGLPEDLLGIFWMDQTWASSVGQDPAYRAEFPIPHPASEELLACFGDDPLVWDAENRVLGPCPNGAGVRGHWTFLDQGDGKSIQLEASWSSRMCAYLRFSEDMTSVWIDASIRVLGTEIHVPEDLFAMRMRKKDWGWDRVTTIGANVLDEDSAMGKLLLEILPKGISDALKVAEPIEGGAFHYPLLQIVDGEGKRTKHYDEYLAFVNTASKGDGSHLVGRFQPTDTA